MECYCKKMLQTVAIISFFILVSGNSMSGNFQVCHLECNNDETGQPPIIANSPPTSRFLRGKSGPRGEKGSRGDVGAKGDVGVSCDSNEIEDLKTRVSQLESDKIRNDEISAKLMRSGKEWVFCGAGIQVNPDTGSSIIADGQITASSTHSTHYPYHGRLFSTAGNGAWCALSNNGGDWIQVDFEAEKTIYGIVTQGTNGQNQHVTSYQVSYQRSNEGFTSVVDKSGVAIVFQGNNDVDTPVGHNFPQPITARYFRVLPQTYSSYTCLRFELYTC